MRRTRLCLLAALTIGSTLTQMSCSRTNSSEDEAQSDLTAPQENKSKNPDTKGNGAREQKLEDKPVVANLNPPESLNPETTEQRLMWLEKVGQLLLHGETLSSAELLHFLGMSRQDVLDELMTRPSFIETTADFGLFFLGFRTNRPFYFTDFVSGESPSSEYAAAMHAAREVAHNGNFLTLLNNEQPLYLSSLDSPSLPDRLEDPMADPAAPSPTDAEKRAKIRVEMTRIWDETETATTAPDRDFGKFCQLLFGNDSGNLVRNYGLPIDMSFRVRFSSTGPLVTGLRECNNPSNQTPQGPDWTALNATVKRMRAEMLAALDLADSLVAKTYAPKVALDLVELDGSSLGVSGSSAALGPIAFWNRIQNSSTNYNRRRASYVLKRYFCDDLTPINVQIPSDHAGDQHGSDPSCQSCHYKLDPMAGFFRNIGFLGVDLTGTPTMLFDDNASKPIDEFAKAWAAPAGSARAFNVGFIRSNVRDEANSYGSSMQDLFAIIKTAPEVRQCLVRRLYEYYVSPTQAFDVGYLEYLTARFNETAARSGSSAAYKTVVAALLTSNGFGQADPISAQCYDYAPGDNPLGKPPCQVAAILQRNCASCHKGESSAAGLDLSVWKRNERGDFSFPHRNIQDRKTTLGSVLDRITTGDEHKRMPLKMDMPPADLEKLFKWVNQVLTEGGTH